jgi:hypothetical protein
MSVEKIDECLRTVKRVLENNRSVKLPENVSHSYNDKFSLVEFVSTCALRSLEQILRASGGGFELDATQWEKLTHFAQNRSVTLRLCAEQRCTFVRKIVKEASSFASNASTSTSSSVKIEHKVVTRVTEFVWQFEAKHRLFAFVGNRIDDDDATAILIGDRIATATMHSAVERSPRPECIVCDPLDVNIGWLLRSAAIPFAVDRQSPSCKTPRRCAEVDVALDEFERLRQFCVALADYFGRALPANARQLTPKHLDTDGLFVPVAPLFDGSDERTSAVLSGDDMELLIAEHARSIDERVALLRRVYGEQDTPIARREAALVVMAKHAAAIVEAHAHAVDYVEQMLREQLIAAVGKVLAPPDFDDYMRFGARRLFAERYRPRQFCFAVRRANDRAPEGTVSIVGDADGAPIATLVRAVPAGSKLAAPMRFPLSAAVDVRFGGARHVHAYVRSAFGDAAAASLAPLHVEARARHFSGFIVMLGHIGGAGLFLPSHAVLVQNRCKLSVPLELAAIPSAKEFADAIDSLSPVQQKFAKAYRAMQLQSTLFALCIVQIKPQLERLLNLPPASLIKDIALSDDLFELFVKYQVPSDLMRFDGCESTPAEQRVEQVRGHVAQLKQMIEGMRAEVLRRAAQEKEASRYPTGIYASVEPSAAFLKLTSLGANDLGAADAENGHDVLVPVILDLGSADARACFAADGEPRVLAPTAIGRPRHMGVMIGMGQKDSYGGADSRPVSSKMSLPSAAAGCESSTEGGSTEAPAGDAASSSEASSEQQVNAVEEAEDAEDDIMLDFTKIPVALDARMEALDGDSALRPTIVSVGHQWQKTAYASLLSGLTHTEVGVDEQRVERNRAFDLLDALSRSGALAIDECELHVFIASTRCFDKLLFDVVVQDSVNPIDKVERSMLITQSTLHNNKPAEQLIDNDEQRERVAIASPMLFS